MSGNESPTFEAGKDDLTTGERSFSQASCPICFSSARDTVSLFQHINASHISQRCFPDAAFLESHRRRLCSDCGFAYGKRFSLCRRSFGPGFPRCRGKMVDAHVST